MMTEQELQERREARAQELAKKLSASGLRVTSQRLAIVRALLRGHLTAEEVHSEVLKVSPSTSLGTVYKTLDTLKALNEIVELTLSPERRHFDVLNADEHPHVLCTKCGEIADVRLEGIESLLERAECVSGYKISSEHLTFYGVCADCQAVAKS